MVWFSRTSFGFVPCKSLVPQQPSLQSNIRCLLLLAVVMLLQKTQFFPIKKIPHSTFRATSKLHSTNAPVSHKSHLVSSSKVLRRPALPTVCPMLTSTNMSDKWLAMPSRTFAQIWWYLPSHLTQRTFLRYAPAISRRSLPPFRTYLKPDKGNQ